MVEASKKAKPQIVADLMIQLGDCYYEQKDSTDSVSAYDKAMNYCLQNKVSDKIQLKCRQKLALQWSLLENVYLRQTVAPWTGHNHRTKRRRCSIRSRPSKQN